MRVRFVVPWVVIRAGLTRAVTKLRWPERWLAGEVAIFPLGALARPLRRPAPAGSPLPAPAWVSIRPALLRRGIRPVWATRWMLREIAAAGTEKLGPAPPRTPERAKAACSSSGEARGTGRERFAPRVSRRPWVDVPAVLRRAGIDLASVDEAAELRLRVAELERRLEAILGGAGGLAAAAEG